MPRKKYFVLTHTRIVIMVFVAVLATGPTVGAAGMVSASMLTSDADSGTPDHVDCQDCAMDSESDAACQSVCSMQLLAPAYKITNTPIQCSRDNREFLHYIPGRAGGPDPDPPRLFTV